MSRERRLKELGLEHLADKPQELQAELARRIREFDSKVATLPRPERRKASRPVGSERRRA